MGLCTTVATPHAQCTQKHYSIECMQPIPKTVLNNTQAVSQALAWAVLFLPWAVPASAAADSASLDVTRSRTASVHLRLQASRLSCKACRALTALMVFCCNRMVPLTWKTSLFYTSFQTVHKFPQEEVPTREQSILRRRCPGLFTHPLESAVTKEKIGTHTSCCQITRFITAWKKWCDTAYVSETFVPIIMSASEFYTSSHTVGSTLWSSFSASLSNS